MKHKSSFAKFFSLSFALITIYSCKQEINSFSELETSSETKQSRISATVPSPYELATWNGFRSAAVSYTFDDNCTNQLAIAIPAMNTYGFKGTLFTVTNWNPNWQGLKSAASNGHEVASHSVSHPTMSTLSSSQQTTEIVGSANAISSNVGITPRTLAWPNCSVGSISIAQQSYIAGRGCSGQVESSTPSNIMNVSSLICGSAGNVKTNSDFQSRANAAASTEGWAVFLIHGMDNDGGYSPLSSTEFKNSLSFFNVNGAKFWVASFGSVIRYIAERDAVTLTPLTSNATNVTLRLSDNLNNSIYNVPITIRRPLPTGWTNASVTQNGVSVYSSIVSINAKPYIMFNGVPDAGDIRITKR